MVSISTSAIVYEQCLVYLHRQNIIMPMRANDTLNWLYVPPLQKEEETMLSPAKLSYVWR